MSAFNKTSQYFQIFRENYLLSASDDLKSIYLPSTQGLLITGPEVHVWKILLAHDASGQQNYLGLLSEDEKNRANRYVFPLHRNRFIACRANLRIILGLYLDSAPQALSFSYGQFGKPNLSNGGLAFNVSHAHDLALIAVSAGQTLGVDLEWMDNGHDLNGIAESIFSALELSVWQGLAKQEKQKAFYDCWVRKEAFVKAVGFGLSFDPKRFSVNFLADAPTELIEIDGQTQAAKAWDVYALDPGLGYRAALVVSKGGSQPKQINFGQGS